MEDYIIENITSKLLDLQRNLRNGSTSDLLEQFLYELRKAGTPIIEPLSGSDDYLVTFIWHEIETIENIAVYGSYPGVEVSKNFLIKLEDTPIWYKSFIAKKDIASTYFFSINDFYGSDSNQRWENAIHDPLNPNQIQFPGYDNKPQKIGSILTLPSSGIQIHENMKNVCSGNLHTYTSKSKILKNERTIWVYTPSDYEGLNQPCHLLIVFDGREYKELINIPKSLDSLYSERRIPPTVAILVDHIDRDKELPCFKPFADYVALELLPWVQQKFNVTLKPEETVVAGSSYGGLAASYAAINYPKFYGNVLSQSGSYWWNPEEFDDRQWIIDEYEKTETLPINFYIEVGMLEHQRDMIETNRRFRDVLITKGYAIRYDEFAGGHDYLLWKSTFPKGLLSLIGSL